MNDKIKKFYYLTHKSRNHKLVLCVFQNMISLIESCFINKVIYIFFIMIDLFQSLCLSLEISYKNTTHINIKDKVKYFHLGNYFNKDYMNFSTYLLISYLNISVLVILVLCFFAVSIKRPSFVVKIIHTVTAIFLTVEKYFLIIIHFSILIAPFQIKLNHFDDNNSTTSVIFVKGFNTLFLFVLLFVLYFTCILFNDYSVFKHRLPWSSPFNYIDIAKQLLKMYIIFAGTFWRTIYLLNIVIINSFCGYIIYSRSKCPFFFDIELNYFTIFAEGSFISFASLYSILNIFWKDWLNYDMIYLLLISFSIGICYLVFIIFIDSINIRNFNKKIEYFIVTNKISEYDLYIFLLRISDIIKKSLNSQKNIDLIISFYTQHKMSCTNSACHCRKIEELISKKNVMYRSDSNEEEQGSLINDKDLFDDEEKKESNYFSKRNKKESEKHLKLWGALIDDIFDLIDWNMNNYIKIEFANFLSFYLKKYVRSLIEISYISKKTLSFHFQFYLFYSKIILIKSNKKLFECEKDVNFYTVLEYNRYYDKFLQFIRDSSEMSISLWRELLKNVFQPEMVEKLGFSICKKATKIEKYSKAITEKNANDIRCLKIYGTFLCHVLKIPDESKALMDKAFLQLVMATGEIEKSSKSYNFLEDKEVGVIVVNGNKESIGRIEYINSSFMNIYGYSKEEIIGRNVSTIMPLNIGKYHNQFMLNFYTTSKPKLINQITQMIGLNKERLIHPVNLFIKILPCIEEGIAYIGLIKRISFSNITKGPKHIRKNVGYIMTTDDGMLLHYNKIIEEKFNLNASLMYDDTKDKSELFRIEMVFPELSSKGKMEQLQKEELRLFFTVKIIEVLKRMEYSKVYEILEKTMNDFEKQKRKMNEDCDKRKTMLSSSSFKAKKAKKNKTVVSVAQTVENSDFIKKNTATVSVTHFAYSMNVRFMIYQIVFVKGAEQNISNIIKRYQRKYEESRRGDEANNQDLQITNVLSVQSQGTTKKAKVKGTVLNVFTSARGNTFKQEAPKMLNLITIINIVHVSFFIAEILIEIIIAVVYTNRASNAISLSNSIQANYFHLKFIEISMYYYGLFATKSIDDPLSFNNTKHSELYYEYIIEALDDAVNIKDEILIKAQKDKSIGNMLTESNLSFKTYYDESSYTITSQSLISSIIVIVNYHNSLLSSFRESNSSLDYNDIIANSNGEYILNTTSDVQKNVVKSILSIRENFDTTMKEKYFSIINELILKHTNTILDLKHIFLIMMFLCLFVSGVFYVSYTISYVYMSKMITNILLLFSEISLDTLEKCLNEVKRFNKNIEKIIQDDVFFLSNYYNDGQNDQTKYLTTTTSGLMNNQNIYGSDYNLGLEPDNDDIKQVFNKYNKKEMISIKEYLEDKKENEIQFSPLLPSGNNVNSFSTSFNLKENITRIPYVKDSESNANFRMNSNTSNPYNETNSLNTKDKEITSRRGSVCLDPSTLNYYSNNVKNNTNDNETQSANKFNKYKRRAIHRKTQLLEIKRFSRTQYPELYSIIFSVIIILYTLLSFGFNTQSIQHSIKVFSIYDTNLYYKLYLTNLYPMIVSALIDGEISNSTFDDIMTDAMNNTKRLHNENNHFVLKNSDKYKEIESLKSVLSNGYLTCNYTVQRYQTEESSYKIEPIRNYCLNSFYASGAELGDNEFINSAINKYNEIRSKGDLSDVLKRKEILNDITLLEGIDFNLFIIEIFYTRFLDEYSNYLKSKTNDIQSLYMIKFGLCVVLVGIIIFLYFGVVYKKYLEKTIYAKAMILLIPRSELEKEGNYKIMKKFE